MQSAPAIPKIKTAIMDFPYFHCKEKQNTAIFEHLEISTDNVDISQKTAKDLKLIDNSYINVIIPNGKGIKATAPIDSYNCNAS